ncbi:partial Arginine deiminase, partial [Gammaproteobacteria bacterium]
ILHPVPNAYFTRDPAVVVGDRVIVCKPHFEARYRESLIIRTILQRHPHFGLSPDHFVFGLSPSDDRPFTVEGGDILVLSQQAVAIGSSQRTRSSTIQLLAKRLFARGLALRVYEIPIPAERTYMHLDTVFTVVAKGIVVAYPDVMRAIRGVIRYEPIHVPGEGVSAQPSEDERPFFRILGDEFGMDEVTICETGGNEPHKYASREQRADGTNMFAIAPKVVVSYDRSEHTNEALEELGVEVLRITGSELVRGLGGPRCMTMPLRRSSGG